MDKNNQLDLMMRSTISAILAVETLVSWVLAAALAFPVAGWLNLPLTNTFGNLYALLAMILIRLPILGIITSVVTIMSHGYAVVMIKSAKRRQVSDVMSLLRKAGVSTELPKEDTEEEEELIG